MDGDDLTTRRVWRASERRRQVWKALGVIGLALTAFGLSFAINLTREANAQDAFSRALAYWATFWAVWLVAAWIRRTARKRRRSRR